MDESTGSRLSVSLLNEQVKPLSTAFNSTVLGFFYFFSSAAGSAFNGISILKYLTWGLTLVDAVNGALIFLTVYTFTQALVGIYGDKVVTKYGRRKPFVFIGNIIRYFAILLFSAAPSSIQHTRAIFAWYIIFGILYNIGTGIQANPFNSWIIESTADDADFMTVNTIPSSIGVIIGGITVLLVISLSSPLAGGVLTFIGGIISVTATVYFLPSVVYRQAPAVPKPIPSLRICLQSPEFRTILNVGIVSLAALALLTTLTLFVLVSCFDLNREVFAGYILLVISIIGAICGMILNICCNWILKKIDKIRVLALIFFIIAAAAAVSFFLSLNASTLYFYCGVATLMVALAFPLRLILSLLLRDLVVFDTFVTRYNRENMYLTANGIPTNILSSFLAAIPAIIIQLSGFKSNEVDDDHIENLYSWNSDSLWVLRISTTFVVSVLLVASYIVLRNHPLTHKVVEQVTKIVKNRELVRETGDLQLRGNSTNANHNTTAPTSLISEDLEEEVNLTNDEREDLLHLSAAELYRIHAAIDSQVYRPEQGVYLIKTLLKYGFAFACFTLFIMVLALIINSVYFDSSFSTILIYFILLVAFYAFYEFFRYTTVRQFLTWDPKELKKKSKVVYEEFTKKGDNLATMLYREGIHPDSLSRDAEDSHILDLGIIPKSIIENDLKEEDLAEEAFVGLSGYKRIFFTLLTLSILSVLVIIVSVAN